MMQCGQRTGFLTFTMCQEPAIATCVKCGKMVCANHLQNDASGPCCPDCVIFGLDPDEAHRRGIDSSYYRWSSDRDFHSSGYTSSDYDSFDAGGGEMAGGGAGGDWDSSVDSDDSGFDSDSDSDSDSGGGAFEDS